MLLSYRCSAVSAYLLFLHLNSGRSDQSTASTKTAADSRSIAMPLSGRTASRVAEGSNSLSQQRIAPAGPIINTTAEERPRFVGAADNRPLGAWGEQEDAKRVKYLDKYVIFWMVK
jgi:hypothetical protein